MRARRADHARRSARFLRAPALIAGVSLVLTGCGSGGDSSTNAATAAKVFIANANAICARSDAQARALLRGSKLEAGSVGAMAAIVERTERELARLKAPPADAASFQRYLALVTPEVRAISAMAGAVRRHDLAAAQAQAAKLNGRASNEAAQQLGLTVCAREIGAAG